MGRRMVLYRGSLKSCNYHCSYCPFSKHRMAGRELEKDRMQWEFFVQSYEKYTEAAGIHALMVAPYGEALLHPWYWEGLARISALFETEAAGAQTNLSFPVQESLELYKNMGGKIEKLRIWATFHPEMVSGRDFAASCRSLHEAGVMLCAGAVGVPENIPLLKQLRRELPPQIYLWINRMDGMQRAYTPQEIQDFVSIDPYFSRELLTHAADAAQCRERLFVEGNGNVRLCNISRPEQLARGGDAWDQKQDADHLPFKCSRRQCTCYLAYGGRDNLMNQVLFGPYPLFRIPRRAKAVFLDIEGTLLAAEPGSVEAGLKALAGENIPVFFVSSLPYKDAVRRCMPICRYFSGGIFAAGAHLRLMNGAREKEYFHCLDESCIPDLQSAARRYHFRILSCRSNGRCYKLTLLRAHRRPWDSAQAGEVFLQIPDSTRKNLRYFIEDNCLQITAKGVDKAYGVQKICAWLGIRPQEAYAAGDSSEDLCMMQMTGSSYTNPAG